MKISPEIVLFVKKHPILSTAIVVGSMIASTSIAKQVAPVVGKALDNANQNNRTVSLSIGDFCITIGGSTSQMKVLEVTEIPNNIEGNKSE